MRGIRGAYLFINPLAGITPAHAGNTQLDQATLQHIKDHPRACGEYPFIQYMLM